MDEQMKEGLALGGSSKAQLWGSEVERGGSTLAKHEHVRWEIARRELCLQIRGGGDSDCCLFGKESKS